MQGWLVGLIRHCFKSCNICWTSERALCERKHSTEMPPDEEFLSRKKMLGKWEFVWGNEAICWGYEANCWGNEANKCNQCDYASNRAGHWGHIWKHTVEKNQTYATRTTLHALTQVLWVNMWKDTQDKSQTNATSVIMHPLLQAIWGHIWKGTVEQCILCVKQF